MTKQNEILKFKDELHHVSSKYGETNDCLVTGLALALNIPYEDAHVICKDAGRQNKRGWYIRRVVETAKTYGYKFSDNHVGLKTLMDRGITKISAKRFAEENPVGTFFVNKKGHAFVIIDGVIYNELHYNPGRSYLRTAFKVEK